MSSVDMELPSLENSPASLWSICLEHCAAHPEHIFDKTEEGFVVRGDDGLPRVVCEALIKNFSVGSEKRKLNVLNAFADDSKTNLKYVDLRSYKFLTDDLLEPLLRSRPTVVCLSSPYLTSASITNLTKFGSSIHTLLLGQSSSILSSAITDFTDISQNEDSSGSPCDMVPFLNLPNIRVFGLNSLPGTIDDPGYYLNETLVLMPKLVRLDISNCHVMLQKIEPSLQRFQCLAEINLSNIELDPLSSTLPVISKVTSLRSLDLSFSSSEGQRRSYSGEVDNLMKSFISKLSKLVWLELGGTNLAGLPPVISYSHRPGKAPIEPPPSIPWLADDNRTFEYLGLLNCMDNPCDRDNLPARSVAGDANEKQLLLAVKTYLNKKNLLLVALNNLFNVLKANELNDHKQALQDLLIAMKAHSQERSIQVSGSASLFHIVKGELRAHLGTNMKKQILKIILDALEFHSNDVTMLRNGCLTLSHFQLPQDVMHCYKRLVTILTHIAATRLPPAQNDAFIQRISIYLLNSLACQVDTPEKLLIGELGAMKTMMGIIKERIDQENCDEVMEVAWSMMWNVTDETAKNSERFINEKGMEMFQMCIQVFPNKDELLRNMMGLLGNVAEAKYIRPRLMSQEYLTVFSNLLSSASDGIEVSYNACGVLANLMSDGPSAWTISEPSRYSVLRKMREAISSWKLDSKRNINYRSFKPILRLLGISHTPEVQYWAVWALCNLTGMYKSKYCPLLEAEGGLVLLEPLLRDNPSYPEIPQLASKVIELCRVYRLDPASFTVEEEEVLED